MDYLVVREVNLLTLLKTLWLLPIQTTFMSVPSSNRQLSLRYVIQELKIESRFIKEGWTLKPLAVNKSLNLGTTRQLTWLKNFVFVFSSRHLQCKPDQFIFLNVQPLSTYFLRLPRPGANLGSFGFHLFSLASSALDHSATAPPFYPLTLDRRASN